MLTDLKCRNSKAISKPVKLLDGDGLHLLVRPTGIKTWRYRREVGGKEKVDTLGRYPEMSLAAARISRDHCRDYGHAGVPAAVETLEVVTRRWHARQAPLWKPHHAADVLESLAREIFPDLGDKPIDQIKAPQIMATLRKVEQRGAIDLSHRLRQRLAAVWAFAIAEGVASFNPAAGLAPALKPVVRTGRRPAQTSLDEVRVALKAAEEIPGSPIVKLALRLLALTAVRPGDVRGALWSEVSGDLWTISADRVKQITVRRVGTPDHLVPLSRQAVEVIEAMREFSGHRDLIFPSSVKIRVEAGAADTPISDGTIGVLLKRAGLQGMQSAHGFRASFSSVMNERNPADRDVIELMLAHTPKDAVASAYNRATHMQRRREIAQEWADLLMDGRPPAEALKHGQRRAS